VSRLTRNLIFGLATSVLANVFLVGLLAGRFMRGGHEAPRPGSSEHDMEMGAPMRGVWRKHGGALRPRSEAVHVARRAVRETLVAEPFQPEALESALSRLRTETDATQVALHRALVDAARELSLEDRRRLADSKWFLRGPRGGPRGH
jgi:uncharacterized membrane protein